MSRLTQSELDNLIAEVESTLVTLTKSEAAKASEKEEVMQKSYDMQKDAGEEEELMDASPAAPMDEELDAAPAAEAEEEAMEAPAAEIAPEGDEMMDAGAEMQADDAGMEAEADGMEMAPEEGEQEDVALDELYASLPEELLQEHYEAITRAMQKSWEKEAMEKAAMVETDKEANGGEIKAGAQMAKSETDSQSKEVEALKKEKEDLEKAMENLVKSMSSKLPARKSATELKDDGKVEEPKLEGDSLKKKAIEITAKPLQKSERALLNQYFVSGSNVEEVRELIKKVNKA